MVLIQKILSPRGVGFASKVVRTIATLISPLSCGFPFAAPILPYAAEVVHKTLLVTPTDTFGH